MSFFRLTVMLHPITQIGSTLLSYSQSQLFLIPALKYNLSIFSTTHLDSLYKFFILVKAGQAYVSDHFVACLHIDLQSILLTRVNLYELVGHKFLLDSTHSIKQPSNCFGHWFIANIDILWKFMARVEKCNLMHF